MIDKKATRQSFGEAVRDLGGVNKNIVVLDSDLSGATKTNIFAKEFPERFINMGIAEQDMISTAAGLATTGKIPFAATFAVFATGRSYDEIRNSVCYPNLNVKIVGSHAGITVGEDGATHQMLEDIALMRSLPNMKILVPSDDVQTKWAVKKASELNGPVYIRTCRMATPVIYDEDYDFEFGKAVVHGTGNIATVFAMGDMVSVALDAKEKLDKIGLNIRVVDMHTIKPIDKDIIVKCAIETQKLISIEDHNIIGGLGTAISEVLTDMHPQYLTRIGINDIFGKSGKADELLKYFELTVDRVMKEVLKK